MLWGNTACCVKLSGEDSSRWSNKNWTSLFKEILEMSVPLLSCQQIDVTVTNVCESFSHTSWRENSCHRYDMKKLRHGRPICYVIYHIMLSYVSVNYRLRLAVLKLCSPRSWRCRGVRSAKYGTEDNEYIYSHAISSTNRTTLTLITPTWGSFFSIFNLTKHGIIAVSCIVKNGIRHPNFLTS